MPLMSTFGWEHKARHLPAHNCAQSCSHDCALTIEAAANLADATVFLHGWKFLSEARRSAVAERRDRYEHLYRRVIEEGIQSGAFAECDPKMAALLVLSAVNWLPQWYKPSGPLSPAEVADEFSDLILSGLAYSASEI